MHSHTHTNMETCKWDKFLWLSVIELNHSWAQSSWTDRSFQDKLLLIAAETMDKLWQLSISWFASQNYSQKNLNNANDNVLLEVNSLFQLENLWDYVHLNKHVFFPHTWRQNDQNIFVHLCACDLCFSVSVFWFGIYLPICLFCFVCVFFVFSFFLVPPVFFFFLVLLDHIPCTFPVILCSSHSHLFPIPISLDCTYLSSQSQPFYCIRIALFNSLALCVVMPGLVLLSVLLLSSCCLIKFKFAFLGATFHQPKQCVCL